MEKIKREIEMQEGKAIREYVEDYVKYYPNRWSGGADIFLDHSSINVL